MSGDYDIHGRRAQGDGTPMGAAPSVITAQVGDDTNPAVGAIPTVPHEGRYLVVFESPNYSPPVQNIYAVRLLGDLTQEGSILWLSQQQTNNVSPAAAARRAAVATWWL